MSESSRISASDGKRSAAATLGREISTLCSYVYAAEARLIALIGRFDSEDCHEALGFPSTAHWLNYQCGVGMSAAREKIRVARALPDLPRIRESFENGVLSYSKVRALTRIAVPANELQLLEFARQGTAHPVERLVSKVRRAQRQEDETKAELVYASRSLSWFHDEDGALVVKARLPADQDALLLKALEHAVEAARAEGADDVTAVTSHLEDGPQVTAETSRRIACDCSLLPVKENVFGEPLDIGRKTRSIPPAIRRALTLRDGG